MRSIGLVRPLADLISDDPAWPQVQSWIAEATNDVRVLPVERASGEEALARIQVTSRSPMGAVALETAGLLIDHGWVRLLGACEAAEAMSLAHWNGLAEPSQAEAIPQAFMVAHDALGGQFALNGGAFPGERGGAFYFAPDTLEWFDMQMTYSGMVCWMLGGDVAGFYRDLRWAEWEAEVAQIEPAQGFHLWPPPFTEQGQPVECARRGVVPITELCSFYRTA